LKGKFITLEGIDGSGKSTQIGLLAEALRGRGYDVVTTCEPGGTPLGQALRRAFLETTETVEPMAELLAFAADRAQHVEHVIRPSLAAGKIVISDRYADATFAYQGAGRGFPEDKVNQVIKLVTDGLKPDLTLFFDITVEIAIERMAGRDESHTKRNRMDDETAEFYSRVREAYLGIAEREPERFRVIEASGTPDVIHRRALEVVLAALNV
jgi:dTMP kinase